MSKFYFTYGTSRQFPYEGGWTEVEACNERTACEAFRAFHRDVSPNLMNCSGVYTEEAFKRYKMYTHGNFGAFCHEKITLLREYCDGVSDMLQNCSTDSKGEQHD